MAMWSCTDVIRIYRNLSKYFTGIKMVASLVLLLGLFDNITSPLQHMVGGGTITYQPTVLEWVIRIFFIFCGTYGLLKIGASRRIRATIVSLPLLYLTTFYFILFLQYHNMTLMVPVILAGVPGIWVLLFGDLHD